MNDKRQYWAIFLLLLSCASIPGKTNPAIRGTWIMDRGEKGYVDVVGFKITGAEDQLMISFGEVINGIFDEQEGPVALKRQNGSFSAELMDTRFQIEPDRTGIVFLGFDDRGSRLYHFRLLE